MKKIIFVLTGLLALALFAGCDAGDSTGTTGLIITGNHSGVYSATGIAPSVADTGATVTTTFSSEGSSVSWTGNQYTLNIQVISRIESRTGGVHNRSSNTSPASVSITKSGTNYYDGTKLLNISGDPALGNFTIMGEITATQSGLLLTPEVTIKFTNLTFTKN